MLSAYAASGLLALPVSSNRLFVAYDDPLLEMPIGRVRITKSLIRDRDPYALSNLIEETLRRNPNITAFHVRHGGADYSSLLESLSTRLPSDHAQIHSHYMAAHPVDAEPLTTLRPEAQARQFRQGGVVQGGSQEEVVPLRSAAIR